MRILIFGAGVIGSLYAALLCEAGFDTAVLARGNRLKALREKGLRYKYKDRIKTAKVRVISELEPNDRYDFVFLTVRENQLEDALKALAENISPTIVTMVNSLDTYDKWENICGKGRILPGFPGAGGSIKDDILDAGLTPRIVQPTTIGKTDGREKILADIFRKANIPCQIAGDMHSWQICHLGMVVPIADAYYESNDPKHAGYDHVLMRKTAARIRRNFKSIKRKGIKLSPGKMNVFFVLPNGIITLILGIVFRSKFGETFMYQHSMKAPDEMRELHRQFYGFLKGYKGEK